MASDIGQSEMINRMIEISSLEENNSLTESSDTGNIRYYSIIQMSFTDVLSIRDWHLHKKEIFIISIDPGCINCVALVRKGAKVATGKNRIHFDKIILFPPISFKYIFDKLPTFYENTFILSAYGPGGKIPLATWNKLLDSIKSYDHKAYDSIMHLYVIQSRSNEEYEGVGFSIMAEERDAIKLAFDISDIRSNDHLNQWVPNTAMMEPSPFISGLTQTEIREDRMIEFDNNVFGDWTRIGAYCSGEVQFTEGNKRLTIVNVNRSKMEETTGVDLIYYHHEYQSYVMVQYKRMIPDKSNDFLFYLSNEQYNKELQRMNHIHEQILIHAHINDLKDYRLHPGFFYFKFCKSVNFDPESTKMLSGLYYPLDLWNVIVNSAINQNDEKLVKLSYNSPQRHFNTELFAKLVGSGFIGSHISSKEFLTDLITSSLSSNHSVTLAQYNKI